MNDLDAQRPSPQPQQEQEEPVERQKPEVRKPLTGLEWLVRQAQRRREERPSGPAR
ncbi:hypothetical protein ACFXGA_13345 [Actinosynnema sp. NPDC059335]|uniref:hypothetical protein n=1 Tax=Actinosynnema sp. NPDC059335 TaxID=3346804 RepID=UPI00367360B9